MAQLRQLNTFVREINKYSRVITQNIENGAAQAMLYSLGLDSHDLRKAQVGIASMWYQGNPCNSKLNIYSDLVAKSVEKEELLPMQFNTIGISDGISMGTDGMKYSLPSRDLISDSIESVVRGMHYDGVICIPGCDKNLPGSVMAMLLLDRPSFLIYGGSMRPSYLNEKNNKLDIVSAFEAYGKYISKEITNEERQEIVENSCDKSCGSCSGLYTANTMATIFEVMGLTLPNSSSSMSLSNEKYLECSKAGDTIHYLLREDIRPSEIVTKESFKNAIKMLYLTGGSTNAIIHLLAIANVANINLKLEDFSELQNTPVLLNMKPHGENVMYDLYKIGGTSAFIKYLVEKDIINGNVLTVTGDTLFENVRDAPRLNNNQNVVMPLESPFIKESHIRILKGNMAPKGCVSKISGKTPKIISKKAIVFDNENDMMNFLVKGIITKDHFIVLRYQGETTGCPEMLKPTSSIIGYFGDDAPPLATDGRFSGGSHGVLICHLPDAYKENSITSIIKNGDEVILDYNNNSIKIDIDEAEIDKRFKSVEKPELELKGYLSKFSKLVGNIENGYSTY